MGLTKSRLGRRDDLPMWMRDLADRMWLMGRGGRKYTLYEKKGKLTGRIVIVIDHMNGEIHLDLYDGRIDHYNRKNECVIRVILFDRRGKKFNKLRWTVKGDPDQTDIETILTKTPCKSSK